MYVSLALCKQHLNIEANYTAEDTYLTHLIEVAEKTVEKHIDFKLEDYSEDGLTIPAPLKQAILLFIGDLYMSREGNAYGVSVTEIPFSYDYLLSLYKDYSGINSEDNEAIMIDEICQHTYLDVRTGQLKIDRDFVAECRRCSGAKSRAYQRLMQKVISSARINEYGEVEVG